MMGGKSPGAGSALQFLEAMSDPDEFKRKIEEFSRREQRAIEAEEEAAEKIVQAQNKSQEILNSAEEKAHQIRLDASHAASNMKTEVTSYVNSKKLEVSRIQGQANALLNDAKQKNADAEHMQKENSKIRAALAVQKTHLDKQLQEIERKKSILSQL